MTDATPRFQTGGPVHDDALYVVRRADDELLDALREGELCYVLAPRQIGKSSLGVRCLAGLRAMGARCAWVDLTAIGSDVSAEEWYFGFLEVLARDLGLEDPQEFWLAHGHSSAVQRWSRYLRERVLEASVAPVVVFIDEIDSTMALQFPRDDFFAAVRATHGARARDPAWRRLTFCLMGVASPSDLMRDPTRTPFNIGRRIRLNDFTRAEAAALESGLAAELVDATALLDAIFDWTDGHPYMTQRLCDAALREGGRAPASQRAASLVEQVFLRRGRVDEQCLADIERRFDLHADGRVARALHLYRRLLAGERVSPASDDPVQLSIRLHGLAAEREDSAGALLRPRNAVIATVFDAAWTHEKLLSRALVEPLAQWLASDRNDRFLLRGKALDDAVAWAHGRDDISTDEREFLLAAVDAARREESAAREADFDRERQIERGARASLLAQMPGREVEALLAGLHAVAPGLREGVSVPTPATEGLLAALAAIRRSQPLRGAADDVRGAWLSPDGAYVAAAMRSGALWLWASREGTRVSSLAGHHVHVRDAAFSPDGRCIATLDARGTIRLWRVPSGELVATTLARDERIVRLVFSPDAVRLATTAEDGAVLLYDAHTLSLLARCAKVAPIRCLVFSPDGSLLAAGCEDGCVYLWEVPDAKLRASLHGHTAAITDLSFSPDGERLASASEDGTARLWEVAPTAMIADISLVGHDGPVTSVAFSRDGKLLLSAGGDGLAILWSARDATPTRRLMGHSASVRVARFARRDSLVLTASEDCTARLWEVSTGNTVEILRGHTAGLVHADIARAGEVTLTLGQDREARLWRPTEGLAEMALSSHSAAVTSAVFSPDGRSLITTSQDQTARLWNLATGREEFAFDAESGVVWSGAFSSDGTRVVTACHAGSAWIWNVSDGQIELILDDDDGPLWGAAFSPDGRDVAAWGHSPEVRLWETASGALLGRFTGHERAVTSLEFSPGGARIATGGEDGSVCVWSVASRELLAKSRGHREPVRSVTWSPDGARVLAAGGDDFARLIDAATGETVHAFDRHGGVARTAAFSADGANILTASDEGVAQVWSATSFELIHTLHASTQRLWTARFSPDGRTIVTAGDDRTPRLWDASRGALIASLGLQPRAVVSASFSPDGARVVTVSDDAIARVYFATVRGIYERAAAALSQQPEIASSSGLVAL